MPKTGLPANATTPLKPGEKYIPWVEAHESPAEFTVRSILLGIFFGILFGSANAYLGLKSGLTISTSIPVAVMTVAAFRAIRAGGGKSSILEANLAQTTGSASSSVASGVIFTLPALFLWGLSPSLLQMTLLAMCGGLLGVLFMIPLRRFLIEREHGNLPYPEGTACAEVLVATEVGGNRAKKIFLGIGAGMGFKFLTDGLKAIPGAVHAKIPFLPKGEVGLDLSPALFGVGYILGPRIAAVMVGGGALAWLVIIPVLAVWGEGRPDPLYPESALLIRDMSPSLLWTRYVRYIGAGAVAAAGIITLLKSIPTMVESFRIGASEMKARVGGMAEAVPRTSQDLPMKVVFIGSGLLALILTLVPQIFGSELGGVGVRAVAAICVVIFAFFFVTVASRIVGLVGVTSNPTSGMTIASLLGTSAIFLALGWTDMAGKATALTVGCVVAIAASISGDTSQDLKTGFLLGATPKRQQVAELIGVLSSATFVCLSVLLLAKTYGFGTADLAAPQATLMKLVIDGVLDQALPWTLVAIGAGIAIVAELARIPSLPFAVGVYLPLATMTPVFLGGLIRWMIEKRAATPEEAEDRRSRGVLLGSGFVGGEGLLGVGLAAFVAIRKGQRIEGIGTGWAGGDLWIQLAGAAAMALLVIWFIRTCKQPDEA